MVAAVLAAILAVLSVLHPELTAAIADALNSALSQPGSEASGTPDAGESDSDGESESRSG